MSGEAAGKKNLDQNFIASLLLFEINSNSSYVITLMFEPSKTCFLTISFLKPVDLPIIRVRAGSYPSKPYFLLNHFL